MKFPNLPILHNLLKFCTPNCHNPYLLSYSFWGSEVKVPLGWVLCSGSPEAEVRLLAMLYSHLEAQLSKKSHLNSFSILAEFISCTAEFMAASFFKSINTCTHTYTWEWWEEKHFQSHTCRPSFKRLSWLHQAYTEQFPFWITQLLRVLVTYRHTKIPTLLPYNVT